MATFTDAARTALRKCIGRQPGEGVILTDDEVRGLFDWLTVMGRQDAIDYVEAAQAVMGVGEAEYLAAVNDVRTLRAKVDAMRAVVEAAERWADNGYGAGATWLDEAIRAYRKQKP